MGLGCLAAFPEKIDYVAQHGRSGKALWDLARTGFLHKPVMPNSAGCDQAHRPLRVLFWPDVLDRVNALLWRCALPESVLIDVAVALERGGA